MSCGDLIVEALKAGLSAGRYEGRATNRVGGKKLHGGLELRR